MKLSFAALLALLLLGGLTAGQAYAGEPARKPAAAGKVVLIGVDAATWKVMLPLMDAGGLPNMARLMREGAWGVLTSEEPTSSPTLWTTIATGMNRKDHGIEDFIIKLPGEYETTPVTSDMRRRKALWNIFSEKGKTAGFINWWATWPAEKVDGFIVSSNLFYLPMVEKSGRGSTMKQMTYPPSLLDEVGPLMAVTREDLGENYKAITGLRLSEVDSRFSIEGVPEGLDPASDEYATAFLKYTTMKMCEIELGSTAMGRSLYKKYSPDIFGIYYQGIDTVQHEWWKYYEPRSSRASFSVSPEDAAKYGKVIPNYYEFTDRMIGRLLEEAGNGTNVIIVSDHGMMAKPLDLGFVFRLNRLFDRLGLLKFLDEEKNDIDFSRTKVIDFGHNDYWKRERSLFVNLKGRDKKGAVEKKDYEAFRKKLAAELTGLKTVNGVSVFKKVSIATASHKEGQAGADLTALVNVDMPLDDVIVINGRGYLVSDFISKRTASGEHDLSGIIIASGPRIIKGVNIKGASIYDVTPTVLAIAGLPVARDMKGRVLSEIIRGEELKKRPIKYISSYEGRPGADGRAGDKAQAKEKKKRIKKSVVDEEIKKKLRSLGYIQ
ncbi:MAG: alkaline phosphatase family protein [Nitrospirae bacterium]|nr:alkaline phosphatase family protein [Nitrospirota bacterium]